MIMQPDCINPENAFSAALSSCWSYGLFLKTHQQITNLIKPKTTEINHSYLMSERIYKSLIIKKDILCRAKINPLFFSQLELR